jgi:hypothetical protein
MVADYLQQDLVDELKRLFDGALFRTPGEPDESGKPKMAPLRVFPQALPIPEPANPPDGDLDPELIEEGLGLSDLNADPYPYIIVRVESGSIKEIGGEQTVKATLLFGAFDDSYTNQGHRDVLHMIQKIYERFSKNAILAAKYENVMPINWALQDEESYPYYFGGMELFFNTLPIGREDPYV